MCGGLVIVLKMIATYKLITNMTTPFNAEVMSHGGFIERPRFFSVFSPIFLCNFPIYIYHYYQLVLFSLN